VTGFNMPPGCSVSDIPGNRPEDLAAEAAADAVYNFIGRCLLTGFKDGNPVTLPLEIDEEFVEKLAEWVDEMTCKAYGDGYAQAQSDAAEAQRLEPFPEGPPSGT